MSCLFVLVKVDVLSLWRHICPSGVSAPKSLRFFPCVANSHAHTQSSCLSFFAAGSSINDNSNNNTSRTDSRNPQNDDLLNTINAQASEIANLKTEKSNVETSFGNLKSEHDKVLNENRILKRAVTIQQERQNQASNEIEAARQFKISAEERIRTLEQLVLSLRYHLQAQQTAPGNDFMGIPPRPPDVYWTRGLSRYLKILTIKITTTILIDVFWKVSSTSGAIQKVKNKDERKEEKKFLCPITMIRIKKLHYTSSIAYFLMKRKNNNNNNRDHEQWFPPYTSESQSKQEPYFHSCSWCIVQ